MIGKLYEMKNQLLAGLVVLMHFTLVAHTTVRDVYKRQDEVQVGVNGVTVDLYPVPASDQLTIQVNNVSKSEAAIVSIIDLMGNVVLSERVDLSEGSTLVTKNLSGLVNGTYLTRVQFENGSSIVKKIVKYNK